MYIYICMYIYIYIYVYIYIYITHSYVPAVFIGLGRYEVNPFVLVFLSCRVLSCLGVVLVVSCVVLFLLFFCVCGLFLFLSAVLLGPGRHEVLSLVFGAGIGVVYCTQSIKSPHKATHGQRRSHIPAPPQGAANPASRSDAGLGEL